MLQDIQAVIFDMDGLMIDSEMITFKNHRTILGDMGYDLTFDIFKQTIGLRNADARIFYAKIYNNDTIDFDQLRSESIRMYLEIINNEGVPTKDGLFELLKFLKCNNIKCAVATSTSETTAKPMLEKSGIAQYMDAFVFGDMVKNGKPSPEIYLKACELLAVEPEKSIGLEDSYNGMRSIYDANMVAIMVPDVLEPTKEMEEKAYKIVKSLKDVIELIEV